MCGSLMLLPRFATDLRKPKIELALTFSSLDQHGSCSVSGLIQLGFLLQKFGLQRRLPVVVMTASCHCLNLQVCPKKASEGVSSADSPVAAGLNVPLGSW